jgi:hypothetical protein
MNFLDDYSEHVSLVFFPCSARGWLDFLTLSDSLRSLLHINEANK